MQQFSLDIWLQDKSRKVVTRDGRPVRILCTDCGVMMSHPILTEIVCSGNAKVLEYHYIDGTTQNKNNDLFFADEEEELTEFEKRIYTLINFCDPDNFPSIEEVKEEAEILIDLARKELRKEQQEKLGTFEMPIDVTEPYYIIGKEDALKDLPKWKKTKENRSLPGGAVKIDEDGEIIYSDMVWKGEYFIMLQSLKSLPKEE